MRHIRDAVKDGFIIDDSAAGRPWAYKGPRFQSTESFPCHTELETELFDVLKKVKPVVGAAVAGASNKARPIRAKIYELIVAALAREGSK